MAENATDFMNMSFNEINLSAATNLDDSINVLGNSCFLSLPNTLL